MDNSNDGEITVYYYCSHYDICRCSCLREQKDNKPVTSEKLFSRNSSPEFIKWESESFVNFFNAKRNTNFETIDTMGNISQYSFNTPEVPGLIVQLPIMGWFDHEPVLTKNFWFFLCWNKH